ncbi:hypothetical protein DFH06DRAFT_1323257 [Mycena polygramma]|nr:hypothetical protein DFH06DRAFT_1323257 [Mycena polygramma]
MSLVQLHQNGGDEGDHFLSIIANFVSDIDLKIWLFDDKSVQQVSERGYEWEISQPPGEELNEESPGEEEVTVPNLPPFPISWFSLSPLAALYAPLPKYYHSSSRIFSLASRQWKARHLLLSGPDATNATPAHLHLFKGSTLDDREIEWLEINADSVVFMEQSGPHQPEHKAYLVKVAGQDVGARRKDWNPTDDATRTVWVLQLQSDVEAQRWISAIKSAIAYCIISHPN